MNRRYTVEEFRETVQILRENFEEVILTADVIVGFPGETEEEFNETINFLKEIKFYKIHVFKYSKRENTKAASFPNQVTPEVKEERSKKVIELSKNIQDEYNKSCIGKKVKVLVEEKHDGFYKGHTGNYMYVSIKSEAENLENKIVEVIIESTKNETLQGTYI